MSTDGGLPAFERQQEILRRALARRIVRVKELAVEYGVHEMTIRRDLDQLAEEGKLQRVHGGARLADRTSEELSYGLRASRNEAGKERIARAALALVEEGDTLAFDASTTALALVRMLGGHPVQAIVTSLDAAESLAVSGVPFVLAGGTFHPPARSFVGSFVESTLSRLHPDKAFFSAKGYSPDAGFTDAHLPEVETKTRLLAGAGMRVALLDATKFGGRALARIASTDEVDVVVTDAEPPEDIQEALAAADVRVVVA